MVFTVQDYFEIGIPPPAQVDLPTPDSDLFRYIANRLLDSFDLPWGPPRYLELMQLPDEDNFFFRGAARRSVQDEWPQIRGDIDSGRLCSLGLVTLRSLDPWQLGQNHQVLAYGYDLKEEAGTLTIFVYDPNRPDDDTAQIQLTLGDETEIPTFHYPGGMNVQAFFRTAYLAVNPHGG